MQRIKLTIVNTLNWETVITVVIVNGYVPFMISRSHVLVSGQ